MARAKSSTAQEKGPVRRLRRPRGVGDQENSRTPGPRRLQQKAQTAFGGLRVEVAGRLVGQNQRRMMDQGAGDGRPLEFTARQARRQVGLPPGQADGGEHLRGAGQGPGRIHIGQHQGQGRILGYGEVGQDVKRLEHEAEMLAPEACASRLVQAGERRPGDVDRSGVRRIQSGDQVQEGRLPRPGLAHDRDHFTRRKIQVEALEEESPAGKGLGKASDPQGRGRGHDPI